MTVKLILYLLLFPLFPEANEQRDEGEVTNVRENSVSSTTVKMVKHPATDFTVTGWKLNLMNLIVLIKISREALGPSLIKSSEDMKQVCICVTAAHCVEQDSLPKKMYLISTNI